jgi:uncharacterized metal-binding protein YceD (DUF177 family)
MTADLSRPIALSRIGPGGLTVLVQATPEESIAVAARMGVPAIRSLECRFHLTPGGDQGLEVQGSIYAEGRLHAQVTRECVVSAEDFETNVEDEFAICFVPSGHERDDTDLPDPDLPDEVPYDGDTIDLGEATAEQLGLALDPYPRIEGATLPDLEDEAHVSPFAILARAPRRPGPA